MELIPAGRYLGKIVNYGIPETEKEHPQVAIAFQVSMPDGSTRKINWFGSLHPNSREYTVNQLIFCGLHGSLTQLVAGPEGGALNTDIELDLAVIVDEYDGKKKNKVAWINTGGGFKKMDDGKAKAQLSKYDAYVKSRIAAAGAQANGAVQPTENDDVGF
jgi:hypothetical protein